jgi:RNA polymerase sigma factor (sigma-70 family)
MQSLDRLAWKQLALSGGGSYWRRFCVEFVHLLEASNPTGKALLAFIRRSLRHSHLQYLYTEMDILIDVFLRAHKLIVEGGVEIVNPPAWIRQTSFHCIRELSRYHKRFTPLDKDIPNQSSLIAIDQEDVETDHRILNCAWSKLDPDEQRLLELKIVQGLSWAEIQQLFVGEGQVISEPTLRKKKQRAVEKLRQNYHNLRPLSQIGFKADEER